MLVLLFGPVLRVFRAQLVLQALRLTRVLRVLLVHRALRAWLALLFGQVLRAL